MWFWFSAGVCRFFFSRVMLNELVRVLCTSLHLPCAYKINCPCSAAGKESTCNVGDLDSFPGLGRSLGKGKGYPFQYSGLENCIVHEVTKSWTWLSNFHFRPWSIMLALFAMDFFWRRWHPTPVLLPGKSHGWRNLVGCSPWGCWGSDTTERLTFTFHFHALEKEMATHSSVLAWRIPGMGSLVGCRLWGRTELDMTEAT